MRKTIEVLEDLGLASSEAMEWHHNEGPWYRCKWPDGHIDEYTRETLERLDKEPGLKVKWLNDKPK